MATLCPACSKANPANATYCYYDGRNLSHAGLSGPLQVGTLPFPMPFCFSNGQGCANFNQLALACDERWNEAKGLLANGTWPSFFSAIGRIDLAVAAVQAAKEPDLDVGLSQLLEKLPADPKAMRPPQLSLPSTEENLGKLTPGTDQRFEVMISNRGMLVLRGMVKTDCEWLSFGDRSGPALKMKMFQTRGIYTLPVCVLGHKLRAGRKPLVGEIIIDTNGGAITLPVRAVIPIRPFPNGTDANNALAGAKSPRELALKVKANPPQASVLFEQGAVKAWYASNGWNYPVQSTQASGKGAVQQFFEALGLTKPPRLELDTERLQCKGKVGQQLTLQVTVSTKESRAVYAQAWSNQPWIKAEHAKSHGHKATITLQIEVPPRPGETVQADVTIQGNGQQQFVVPLTLEVAPGPRAGVAVKTEEGAGKLPVVWLLAGAGMALLLILALGVGTFVANRRNAVPPKLTTTGDPINKPAPKNEQPWWQDIPDTKLAASVFALKQIAPRHQALFDDVAGQDELQRGEAYDKLAVELPKLLGNPQLKEPLGRLLAECCVFEPSDTSLPRLLRALSSQIPEKDAEFRPEENGEEVERGLWSIQVMSTALTHNAMSQHPFSVRKLTQELEDDFGFTAEVKATPAELAAQAEKLLSLRCYLNTLPTAKKSFDYALVMRDQLLKKFPQHLAPAARTTIDLDLLALGLSKGNDAWPKLEPILKTSLESTDPESSLKLAAVYEKADPAATRKMEKLLAAKWKEIEDATLTKDQKVQAINLRLQRAADSAKISPEARIAQLQKLTSTSLASVKPDPKKKELALLQDTVQLAHASTMAGILLNKDSGVERVVRFDELVAQVPKVDQTDPNSPPDKLDKAKPGLKGTVVDDRPAPVSGALTAKNDLDALRAGSYYKEHLYALKANQPYTFSLSSRFFNAYLRLEYPKGTTCAEADDGRRGRAVVFSYTPSVEGDYHVVVTTLLPGQLGKYDLQVQKGLLNGGNPFGSPFGHPIGRRGFGPAMPPKEVPVQEAPKVVEKKEKELLSAADLLACLENLESKTSTDRVAAFLKLADGVANDLAPSAGQKIAKYLFVTIKLKDELVSVQPKLESFAKCRYLLVAVADYAGKSDAAKDASMAIVGSLLGETLRFADDEDWRSMCRKKLLHRALNLTGSKLSGADQAADLLRDLYREQGMAFGIEEPGFFALTRPTQVLDQLIKQVAAKADKQKLATEDKEYLEQIGRHLQAAQFLAENDLEHMVLLQRIWIRVLSLAVQARLPAQAKSMAQIQQDLVEYDRQSATVLDQLRAGEEKVLRIWVLAHNLK